MKQTAQAVVIGGGVVGVSTLYHLAKKGWNDVVLMERKELTSGSTWHATGLLPLFNMSYSVSKLHQYSVDCYHQLADETGQDLGFKGVSNIRLASCEHRMDEYRYYAGIARRVGVRINFLSPAEVKEIWPLCNIDGLVGAIQHPDDGYIQPTELTQALAQGALSRGAEIYCNTEVIGIARDGKGWVVKTDQGEVHCQHVVSCTGSFARRTGALVGLELPVLPVEHQYIITEAHPEILARQAQGLPEPGVLQEPDASYYVREEGGSLILGAYEKGAPCCYVDGPSQGSAYELFNSDLDRLMPHVESCIHRVPALGEVGIKTIVNGAIAYTPDGNPIVGPAPGLTHFWLNEGHSWGITAAGGAGWQLAEWIVDGEPGLDMMDLDPRRFGPYAGLGYLKEKSKEAYVNAFSIHYPDEERPAARPLRCAPCYDRMKQLGAVFGQVQGWERPHWFAPTGYALNQEDLHPTNTLPNYSRPQEGEATQEMYSFRRAQYFNLVGYECRHVMQEVGILDMSASAKFSVRGSGAGEWLGRLVANNLTTGQIALGHLLSGNGGVRSAFTIYKKSDEDYYLVSAGAFENHDFDYLSSYLRQLAPDDGSVTLQNITTQWGLLVVAGPGSREVLQKITDTDMSNSHFQWLSGKPINLGYAQGHALRINFVGELGWELHHPMEMQNYIFDEIMGAGEAFDIKPFGSRAMDSMRLEKSYRMLPRDMSIKYAALESGLDRDSPLSGQQKGFNHQFVTLEVHAVTDADARGSEALFKGDDLIGRVTSGGYGFRIGKSLALGLVMPEYAQPGVTLEIEILGTRHATTVLEESPYDPENIALRS